MRAVAIVTLIALTASCVGYLAPTPAGSVSAPLMGASSSMRTDSSAASGWYWEPGRAMLPAIWMLIPPLVGWIFVRSAWIPWVAANRPSRGATLAMARHLSGVYLYVYAMILAGVVLMMVLLAYAPVRTNGFRWLLTWFLFGESFFVPAAMWLRLTRNDPSGAVFGRARYALLLAYLAFFVMIPGLGMAMAFASFGSK